MLDSPTLSGRAAARYTSGMAMTEHITTAEQLFQATGLGRCELLRGDLVMMSPAGSRHGAIALRIGSILLDFVNRRGLGVVLGAETGFQISYDPDTVRAPDAAFVRADRIGGGLPAGFFPGAPDLAVEVLSPSDRASEVSAKVENWLSAGCLAVWVVDPKTHAITVYRSSHESTIFNPSDTLDGGDVLPGFRTPVAEVFVV